jgi:transposase
MLQLVPQLRILLAVAPVDFRKGVDSLAALCRDQWQQDPFSGTLYVFRNRSATALKLLVYDGNGFWLCQRRFSSGKLLGWPLTEGTPLHPLAAPQLMVLLYRGIPNKPALRRAGERSPEKFSFHRLAADAYVQGNQRDGSSRTARLFLIT